jgi:pyridoxal phosphate enzyme (YggS family)
VLENLAGVRRAIGEACERAARPAAGVRLVAVGKTVEPAALAWVVEAGVEDLGENYVDELRDKRAIVPGARWHFVGNLQSRTAPRLADLADVVQSAVPGRALERLGRRASEAERSLPVLLEVDFTDERAGVNVAEVPDACDAIDAIDGVRLVGLMTVPPPTPTAEEARPFFRLLRELRERLRGRHPALSELSMGMSLDFQVAIEEGATMVRIGTALFGARPPSVTGRM